MRTLDLDQFWPAPPSPASSDAGDVARPRADIAIPAAAPAESPPALPRALSIAPDHAAAGAIVAQAFGSVETQLHESPVVRSRRFLRGFDVSAAMWASLGFVAGMVAWHAVGFWGFVHTAVLKGGTRGDVAVIDAQPSRQDGPRVAFKEIITTGSLPTFTPQSSACVALVSDKDAHATRALPCADDVSPMRDAGRRRRADRMPGIEARLQKPESWAIDTQTADVAAPASPASAAPVSAQTAPVGQTVADRDFDMTIHTE